MKSFRERIELAGQRSKSRLVLALDVSGPFETRVDRAADVLKSTIHHVAAVKVNYHLLLPFGLEGIRGITKSCNEAGVPLIADLKMNDIESTNLNIVDSLMTYGFDCVIANPFVGKEDGLGEAIERVHAQGGGVILLVYMSHGGSREGYGLVTSGGEPMYRVFAKRAKEWGADGVVVSAKSAEVIRETRGIVGSDCLIFSPGVGVQGGDFDEGKKAGADYIIVGRGITEAPDPLKVVRELNSV